MHSLAMLAVLAGVVFLFSQAFQHAGGVGLVLYLTGALVLLATLPFLAYRGYALLHASYALERDGFRIRWGLRALNIPLSEVQWVRPAEDLQIPVKMPAFSMPGAVLGESVHPDLGTVEFVASAASDLVIVASMDQIVIVSPEEKEEFIRKFNRTIEMGTLSPIVPFSSKPAVFLRGVFSDRLARITIPVGFGLWFVLLVVVSIAIPAREALSLGYDVFAIPLEPVASSRMLILPVLGILLYAASLIGGAYLFRKKDTQPVSQLMWLGGVASQILLFAAALVFIF